LVPPRPHRHRRRDAPDDGLADIDRLAFRYTGEAYRKREFPRVSAWVRVLSWHCWDASGERKVTHAERQETGS
jgi:hypothetical protein